MADKPHHTLTGKFVAIADGDTLTVLAGAVTLRSNSRRPIRRPGVLLHPVRAFHVADAGPPEAAPVEANPAAAGKQTAVPGGGRRLPRGRMSTSVFAAPATRLRGRGRFHKLLAPHELSAIEHLVSGLIAPISLRLPDGVKVAQQVLVLLV